MSAFLISSGLFSQNQEFKEHISNFNMVSLTYKHDQKWSGYVELQTRSIEDYMLPDYYEIKGGVGYKYIKDHQIFLGAGRYGTYRNSDFYQREYRFWFQYTYSHDISRVEFNHRLRLEKRFFYFPQTDNNTNDERLRYRLSMTVPLNAEEVKTGTFYLNAFDEIFFAPGSPAFKRNRLFGGFGYQMSDFMGTNFGYMWQREFSASSAKNYHFIYFALNFTFDRLKENKRHSIPVAD